VRRSAQVSTALSPPLQEAPSWCSSKQPHLQLGHTFRESHVYAGRAIFEGVLRCIHDPIPGSSRVGRWGRKLLCVLLALKIWDAAWLSSIALCCEFASCRDFLLQNCIVVMMPVGRWLHPVGFITAVWRATAAVWSLGSACLHAATCLGSILGPLPGRRDLVQRRDTCWCEGLVLPARFNNVLKNLAFFAGLVSRADRFMIYVFPRAQNFAVVG